MKGYSKKIKETTEWEDALIKHKVGPYADYDPNSNYEHVEGTETEEENLEKFKELRLQNASLDQLDELEDREDEKVLEEYRRKRLLEMKQKAEKNKYGSVYTISAKDWEKEVTSPSKETHVIVFLYKPNIDGCRLVDEALEAVAHKFKAIKFVKVLSTDAIPNWPDKYLPAFLCYRDEEPKHQLVGLQALGGSNLKAENIEWVLHTKQIIKSDLKLDPKFKQNKDKYREEQEINEEDVYDMNHTKLNYVGTKGLFQDVEEIEEHFDL